MGVGGGRGAGVGVGEHKGLVGKNMRELKTMKTRGVEKVGGFDFFFCLCCCYSKMHPF